MDDSSGVSYVVVKCVLGEDVGEMVWMRWWGGWGEVCDGEWGKGGVVFLWLSV